MKAIHYKRCKKIYIRSSKCGDTESKFCVTSQSRNLRFTAGGTAVRSFTVVPQWSCCAPPSDTAKLRFLKRKSKPKDDVNVKVTENQEVGNVVPGKGGLCHPYHTTRKKE
jgi:hypothetical protein